MSEAHRPIALRVLSEKLLSIVPQLGDAERREYFNLHYWRFLETLKECSPWIGGRVLDIGIVPGHMAMALKRLGCQVFGVSNHEGAAEGRRGQDFNIEERWAREGFTVKHAVVDREPLPFPEKNFDLVLFTEVLEHLVYDVRPLVSEIRRVLKPEGGLVVSTPNVLRLENRIKPLLGRSIYPRVEDFYFENPYKRHNREYTLDELVDLFQPPLRLLSARYIMLTENAVPVSANGGVYDFIEYADISEQGQATQRSRFLGQGGPRAAAHSAMRLCKRVFPPLRGGLLASFVSPTTAS